MTKKKPEDILFKLVNIELVGSTLNTPPDFTPLDTYDFDLAVETRLYPDNKSIILRLVIQVIGSGTRYGELAAHYFFHIDNYNNVIRKNKEGLVDIPENLQLLMNSVAISTSRGLLFSAFRGTALHNAILPIIDPRNLKATQVT